MITAATAMTNSVARKYNNLSAIGFHPPNKKQATTNAIMAFRPIRTTKTAAPAVSLSPEMPQLRTAATEAAATQMMAAATPEINAERKEYRMSTIPLTA
jgi:hypothetical protein